MGDRHLQWATRLVEQTEPELRGAGLGATLDILRARLDKALATWEKETATLESLERTTV